jgi:hypothetical protein
MKKFILSLLITSSISTLNAQNNISQNDGKSFVSKVAYASKKFEPNTENDSLKLEYTRSLKIKAPSSLTLSAKRVRHISKLEPFPINIDTDNPFPKHQVEKRLLDHYLENIGAKIEVDVSKKQTKKTMAHGIWSAGLPMLHRIEALSGIMIDKSNPNNNWSDTLEVNGSIYINQYTIENDNTIKLVGKSAPKQKIVIDSTTTNANPSNGEGVVAKSGGQYMNYSAVIKYDKQTGFITRMEGERAIKETIYVFGGTQNRNVRGYFIVENREEKSK